MTKLKLANLQDETPVKMTIILPAALHRDLVVYAKIISQESGISIEPLKLVVPMLEKFIESDRAFRKTRDRERN